MACPRPSTGLVYVFVFTVYHLLQKPCVIPSPVFPIHSSSLDPPRADLDSPFPHPAGVAVSCHLEMGTGGLSVLSSSDGSD